MNLKETYNKIAEDWFKDHGKDLWWQEGTDEFLSLLSKNASILDVGCGAGIKSKYIAENGFVVTGIDFSEKMIEIAKREFPDIDFEVVDIYEMDKFTKTFDGVFAQAVLLHITKDEVVQALNNLKSKLNAGGLLYIAVKAMREDGVEEGIKIENDYGYEYERFFSYFNMVELEKYIKEIGMEVVWKMSTTSGRAEWLQIISKNI